MGVQRVLIVTIRVVVKVLPIAIVVLLLVHFRVVSVLIMVILGLVVNLQWPVRSGPIKEGVVLHQWILDRAVLDSFIALWARTLLVFTQCVLLCYIIHAAEPTQVEKIVRRSYPFFI